MPGKGAIKTICSLPGPPGVVLCWRALQLVGLVGWLVVMVGVGWFCCGKLSDFVVVDWCRLLGECRSWLVTVGFGLLVVVLFGLVGVGCRHTGTLLGFLNLVDVRRFDPARSKFAASLCEAGT